MLQELTDQVFNSQYTAALPRDGSFALLFEGDHIAMDQAASRFPRLDEIQGSRDSLVYLFSIGETVFFLADAPLPPGMRWVEMRGVRFEAPREMAFAAATGQQLSLWYKRNRICGACGEKTQQSSKERVLFCPVCGQLYYPAISPAVIVGVIHGDSLLLTRMKNRPAHHRALVAGYAEIGETLEETVRREVWEETGLQVQDITYYKSQPWGFSSSLLVGYYARLSGSDVINPQDEELDSAFWVPRGELDVPFDGISMTNEMIVRFAKQGSDGLLRPETPPFVG